MHGNFNLNDEDIREAICSHIAQKLSIDVDKLSVELYTEDDDYNRVDVTKTIRGDVSMRDQHDS